MDVVCATGVCLRVPRKFGGVLRHAQHAAPSEARQDSLLPPRRPPLDEARAMSVFKKVPALDWLKDFAEGLADTAEENGDDKLLQVAFRLDHAYRYLLWS